MLNKPTEYLQKNKSSLNKNVRMKQQQILMMGFAILTLASCVSSKKYSSCEKRNAGLEHRCIELSDNEKKDNAQLLADQQVINSLKEKATDEKKDSLQKQTEVNNLSEISGIQENNMDKQYAYIRQLQTTMDHKDSFNKALVRNLINACGDNTDVRIKTEKGVVYVDIADQLLFASGKYDVTEKAKLVLAKIAVVLEAQPSVKFTLEGHTDNAPYRDGGLLLDNWDLSVKRATSVVRILQNEYHILPSRMNASGYGEYAPSMSNNTKEGMAENRTTRIVILPEMDDLYSSLSNPKR